VTEHDPEAFLLDGPQPSNGHARRSAHSAFEIAEDDEGHGCAGFAERVIARADRSVKTRLHADIRGNLRTDARPEAQCGNVLAMKRFALDPGRINPP
jgi:hypothetical protein